MTTLEYEVDQFAAFAKSQIANGASATTIDALFDQWRTENPPCDDALAINASLRDLANGEIGRPFDEFASEFRRHNEIADGE